MSDLALLAARVRDRFRAEGPTGDPRLVLAEWISDEAPLLSADDTVRLVERVHALVAGLGPLEPLCADPDVSDVLVNGPGPVWVERNGRLERTDVAIDAEEIAMVVERVLGPLGLRVDRSSPIADGRLADGSRVSVVTAPLAIDGTVLSIRRFTARCLDVEAFAPSEVVHLLDDLLDRRANLVIFGGTGSGKTTLLNSLAARLPSGERIVTVEDAAELRLAGEHVVRLESRPANAEGVGAVSLRELMRAALRLRPDRIVVGEVRGAEALEMLWAMSSGHDGSLSTCHASSGLDVLFRLETFVLLAGVELPLSAVRAQVRAAVDALVGIVRLPDGSRAVSDIYEVPRDPVVDRPTELVRDGRVVARPTRRRRQAVA